MSDKFDRRSFLSRTTGSLLATSIFPEASRAGINPIAAGMPGAQLEAAHSVLTPEPVGIFPRPHEMTESGRPFVLNEETAIVLPGAASENDLRLARFLVEELSD